MVDYFVGKGGNDTNGGTTWAARRLTIDSGDSLLSAGDTLYVGPGRYEEEVILAAAGTSGNPITIIGDVSGENTDGIGGIVRITGFDSSDQTETRDNCITGQQNYRTFRGLTFDGSQTEALEPFNANNWIIEDCTFQGETALTCSGTTFSDITFRRNIVVGASIAMVFNSSSTNTDTNILVENCIFIASTGDAFEITRTGDITIRNCLFLGCTDDAIDVVVTAGTGAGQFTTVENCIFFSCATALEGTVTGDIVEDYNTFYANITDRANTATGSNSQTYPPILAMPLLLNGFNLAAGPFGALSEWSPIRAIAGNAEPSTDHLGLDRPATAAKNSWGPIQFHDFERETGTTRTGSVAAVLHDAGVHQIKVPVTAVSTTFSVYVRREANYAGTNPQLIIKQPGQADDTTTDAGSSGAWNELTTTLTPSATTDFVVVELVSNNTATSGSYDVFFDDLTVT